MGASFSGIRGEVYPVLYGESHGGASDAEVDKGAILEVEFSTFKHPISGFLPIMFEKNLL
jgi:hypothetical protein